MENPQTQNEPVQPQASVEGSQTTPPQPTPPASQVPGPVTPPEKGKSKTILWVGLGLLLLALVGIGVYYFVFRETTPTPSPTPVPTQVPTPTPDPTADWGIYENEKYGYSIKYPAGWIVKEESHIYESQLIKGEKIIMTTLLDEAALPPTIPIIQIFFEGQFGHGIDFSQLEKTEQIDLGGKTAEKMTFPMEGRPNKWILIKIDNFHNFKIEIQAPPSQLTLIDQILSTFKFTEATPSATISP